MKDIRKGVAGRLGYQKRGWRKVMTSEQGLEEGQISEKGLEEGYISVKRGQGRLRYQKRG